jgi:hypothetical protein
MAAISCLYAPHGDMRRVDQFAIWNLQLRDTGTVEYTWHMTKTNKHNSTTQHRKLKRRGAPWGSPKSRCLQRENNYFLINICATWGNAKGRSVDHALWIFTNQKLFSLCKHLDFGEPHGAPGLFSFLCCVVLLCLFVFVMCIHCYDWVIHL